MAPGIIHHEYYRKIIPFAILLGILETALIGLYLYKYTNPFIYFVFYCINYSLGYVIDPDNDQLSLTLSEGIILRETKKFHVGFFGACHVSYWFIYAYLIGLVGGHRSKYSHGWFIGTFFRIIYFNIPIVIIFNLICNYGILNWNWEIKNVLDIWNIFHLSIWLFPYLISQFTSWFISDGMHLILDTEWAKNKLYTPIHHNYKENQYDRNNTRNR